MALRIVLLFAWALALLAFAFPGVGQASRAPALGETLDVPVVRQVVPLPEQVSGVLAEQCAWTRDGKAFLCAFWMRAEGIQVGTIRPDGSGFRCLTCGADNAGEPFKLNAFHDGKRFEPEAKAGSMTIATRSASLRANFTYTLPVTLARLGHASRIARLTVRFRSVADLGRHRAPGRGARRRGATTDALELKREATMTLRVTTTLPGRARPRAVQMRSIRPRATFAGARAGSARGWVTR